MPNQNKEIGIIGGTGKEGTGLAIRLAAAGYKVLIGSRQREKAMAAAEKINQQVGGGAVVGLTNQEVAQQAQVCILTAVYTAHLEALESVREFMGGKILVDATSRVDYRDPRPPSPPSSAEEAQKILGPSVKVVAAFQNIPAKLLSGNSSQRVPADVLACSDDRSAALVVIQVAQDAGMHGYYAGPLSNAIVVEGITSLLISLNEQYGVKQAGIRVTGIESER